MYADDTTLNFAAEDLDVLQSQMNQDTDTSQMWLQVNKLTVNIKKTKYMLIGSHSKLAQGCKSFDIKANDIPLERVTVHKSLGILTDENLTWKPYINKISKKILAVQQC